MRAAWEEYRRFGISVLCQSTAGACHLRGDAGDKCCAHVQAMLMGVASRRYLLRMPDLCEVDTEEMLRLITPIVRTLIHPGED